MNKLPDTKHLELSWQDRTGSNLFNPKALQVDAAKGFIRSYTQSIRDQLAQETIPLHQGLGRILAENILAPRDVPAGNNSAMDGFAFHSQVLSKHETITLEIFGEQFAGQSITSSDLSKFDPTLHTIRIMTGALMPPYCDTVVPQEFVSINGIEISFVAKKVQPGDNRRLKGEDLTSGATVLAKGRVLRPSDLGLIASMGFPEVTVQKKIRVAYFSTGNEITPIGAALPEGGLYDSNRYTLLGMLTEIGCELHDLGIVRDDADQLRKVFQEAANIADVIITSGGVSVGEADFTKAIMQELGDVAFWSLAIKPGRPIAFGKIRGKDHDAVLFGLPGNPVAVMVTFMQFVKDALYFMSGAIDKPTPLNTALLDGNLKKRVGRTEYVRGILWCDDNSKIWVKPHPNQGSGVLRSMSESDCLIVLPSANEEFKHGQSVNISIFNP